MVATSESCTNCETYKARLLNLREEQKSAEDAIDRLKNDNKTLRINLKTSQKETKDVQLLLDEAQKQGPKSVEKQELKSVEKQEPKSVEVTKTAPKLSASTKEHQKPSSSVEELSEPPEPKEPKKPKTKQKGEKKDEVSTVPKKTTRKKSGKRSAGKTPKTKKDSQEKEPTAVPSSPKSPPVKEKPAERMAVKEKPAERLVLGECREEKAAYMKVREAKILHLCDKGTQTAYYGRLKLSQDEEGSGTRDGIGGYRRHARRNSLAAGVLAGVDPGDLGHETAAAKMLIQEEIDRLCDDISGFVEFGLELVQQEAKSLHIKAETQLGTEKAAEILGPDYTSQGLGKQRSMKWSDHRRVSVSTHGRRKSSILQQDMRTKIDKRRSSSLSEQIREHEHEASNSPTKQVTDASMTKPNGDGVIKHGQATVDESVKSTGVLQSQGTKPNVEDLSSDAIQVSVVSSATAMEQVHAAPKVSHAGKWWKTKHFVSVVQGMKGGGCSHVFHELQETERAMGDTIPAPEDQLKEQVTVIARHALELLQTTGSLVTRQLNDQLGAYERFFNYWHEVRELKKEEMGTILSEDVLVAGKFQMGTTQNLQERSGKSTKVDDMYQDAESHFALPPLPIPQQMSTIGRKGGTAIATAGLSKTGMMMISGGGLRSTAVAQSNTQGTPQVRRKIKPASKSRPYQPIMSEKSIIERVFSVSNKMDNIQNMLSAISRENAVKPRKALTTGELNVTFPISEAQSQTLPLMSTKALVTPKSQENIKIKDSVSKRSQQTKPRQSPSPSAIDLLPGLLQFPSTNKTWDRKSSAVPLERELQPNSKDVPTKLPSLAVGGGMWRVS